MQTRAEQTVPHCTQLYPNLNLESAAARMRNNINQFENVNLPQNKLVEPIKTNKLADPPDMDFRNQDVSYYKKSMAMYYKGLANLTNTPNVDFKNQDRSCD